MFLVGAGSNGFGCQGPRVISSAPGARPGPVSGDCVRHISGWACAGFGEEQGPCPVLQVTPCGLSQPASEQIEAVKPSFLSAQVPSTCGLGPGFVAIYQWPRVWSPRGLFPFSDAEVTCYRNNSLKPTPSLLADKYKSFHRGGMGVPGPKGGAISLLWVE